MAPSLWSRHWRVRAPAFFAIGLAILFVFRNPLSPLNSDQLLSPALIAYTNQAKASAYRQLLGQLEPRMPELEGHFGSVGWLNYQATTVLGNGFFTLQDYPRAIDYQQRALHIAEQRYGDESDETYDRLSNLVLSLYFISDYTRALPLAERNLALSLHLHGQDSIKTAERQGDLALIYSYSGRDDEAMELSHRALKSRIRLQGLQNEDTIEQMRQFAETLRHQPLGNERAITVDLAALALSDAFVGWTSVRTATLLNDLDYFYRQDYRCTESLPYAEESLAITIALEGPESSEVATRYHSLGTNYFCLGRMREAIRATESALTISRKRFGEKHQNVAYLEAELSDWYDQIDDAAMSEKLGRMAVATLDDTLGDQNEIAPDIFDFVGSAALSWDLDFSVHLSNRFLTAMKVKYGPDETAQIDPLINLSAALIDQGKYAEAEKLAERAVALTLERAEHQSILPEEEAIEALVLSEIAQEKWREAEPHALMALNFSEEKFGIQHPGNASAFNLFALAIRHRYPDLAILFTKRSINLEQPTGMDLGKMGPDAYQNFVRARQPRLDRLKSWLSEDHRDSELIEITALESAEPPSGPPPDDRQYNILYTDDERVWLARYETYAAKRNRLGRPIRNLHRHLNNEAATDEDALLVQHLEARAEANLAEFKRFYRTYPLNQPKVRSGKTPLFSKVPTISQIQSRLNQESEPTAWVRYAVTDDTLHIQFISRTSVIERQVPIERDVLNKIINAFLQGIEHPARDPRSAAQAVFDTLMAPVYEELTLHKISLLKVEASTPIRTLPFAALFDGKHYLVEKLATVFVVPDHKPSPPDQSPAHWNIAAFGVSRPWPGFQSLPYVESELASITQPSPDGMWSGSAYLNDSFNRSNLKQVLDGHFNVIHIASHFVDSHGLNQNSFMLLGDGSLLRMQDLEQEKFDLRHIDLLTLAACESGASEAIDESPDRLHGFPETALRLGVRHVLASLWPVTDEGSSVLMTAFYDHLKTRSIAKARALRQAQLGIMRGSIIGGSNKRDLSHPAIWAPFVLISH